jgi:penicillin-binding protein 1A
MDPVTAYQLVSMLQGVVRRGTAARTVGARIDFPVAGKTGTTNDSRDAWFIGFTPNLVAGCYIGFDEPKTLGRHAYGGTLCGPVFAEFMNEAMKTRTPGEFREPADQGLIMVKMDRETGERLPDDAEGDYVITELFLQGTEPDVYSRVSALSDDDTLFAGMGAERFGIDATDLPFDEESAIRDPGTSTGMISAARSGSDQTGAEASGAAARPKPPASGSLGLGTGGLY